MANQVHKLKVSTKSDYQDAMITEREKEIAAIRKDMQDVNQLFKDTAELIDLQGEQIDNIHNNITDAKESIKHGNKEIKQAEIAQDNANTLTYWIAGGITTTVTVVAGIAAAVFLL